MELNYDMIIILHTQSYNQMMNCDLILLHVIYKYLSSPYNDMYCNALKSSLG
jgi:hypothetical protein